MLFHNLIKYRLKYTMKEKIYANNLLYITDGIKINKESAFCMNVGSINDVLERTKFGIKGVSIPFFSNKFLKKLYNNYLARIEPANFDTELVPHICAQCVECRSIDGT